MKFRLLPAEEFAIQKVDCPLCGQKQGKKCRNTKSTNLLQRPHPQRSKVDSEGYREWLIENY